MVMTKPKTVIRKNSLAVDHYMQKDGTFGAYATAKRFATDDAADAFALLHGVTDHGLFPVSVARRRKGL